MLTLMLTNSKGISQNRSGDLQGAPHCTFLASTSMVSEAHSPPHTSPRLTSPTGGSHCPTPVEDLPPGVGEPPLNVLDVVQHSFRSAGLSSDAASMAARGCRKFTRGTYDSRLQHYHKWCRHNSFDPCPGDFLMKLFNQGLTVATIRGYCAAVGAVHTGFPDGSSISNNNSLTQMLRGMFIERPSNKKLLPAWDLGQVLYTLSRAPFELLSNASLIDLSVKTAFLIATATSRRRSEIHALSIDTGHIRWE